MSILSNDIKTDLRASERFLTTSEMRSKAPESYLKTSERHLKAFGTCYEVDQVIYIYHVHTSLYSLYNAHIRAHETPSAPMLRCMLFLCSIIDLF